MKEDPLGYTTLERSSAGRLRFFSLTILFLFLCATMGRAIIGYAGKYTGVSASRDWQQAGVIIQEEDLVLLVEVGGSWSADPTNPDLPYVGAMGYAASPNISDEWKQYPSYDLGRLVAKTSSNLTKIYPVGLINLIRFNANGTLYLRMNDANLDDNSGAINVLALNLTACLR